MEYVKCNYKDGKVSHILKGKVEDVRVVHYEKGMSTYSIPQENFINATFFSYQKDGVYFSVSPFVENGNKHRWASHDQKSAQSCFIFYKDGTIDMKRIKNISELDMNNVLHVVGGVGLVNLKDSTFKYDPKGEGFGTDILRNCEKSVLGYRDGEIFLVATTMYHSSSTQYDLLDLCKDHNFTYAISLDGGGSTVLKHGKEYKMRGDGRRIANGLFFVKGVDEIDTQNPSQVKICLDYGHRNNSLDYGATNGSIKESALALEIGKKIKLQLEKNNISVIETRKSEDETVSLNDRCKIANDNKANFFLSIHINAADNVSAKGVEVLHYTGANNQSKAKNMCDAICKYTSATNRGAKERNDLAVLKGTSMSALLVECGFISNVDELKLLQDGTYQGKIVRGIIESLGYVYVEDKPIDKPVEPSKETWWRAVCGSFSEQSEAQARVKELQEKGYKDAFVVKFEK